MAQDQVQCSEPAHREADDMCVPGTGRVKDCDGVVDSTFLGVGRRVRRDVRGWIAARRVGDAAIRTREMTHLGRPAAVIARELVDEQQWEASALFLVVELDAVGCWRLHFERPQPMM